MEKDAHAICWPGEEMGPGDRVEIRMSWADREESHAYSSWTYESGQEANFTVWVTWHRQWQDPRSGSSGTRVYFGVVNPSPENRTFERDEAVDFWMRLMRGE